MSTLDDLRTTLDRHAGDVHDTERYVRPAAVRARIRAVRRRRAAVVSAVAALVMIGAVAGFASLGSSPGPEPADNTTVIGVDVPERIELLGVPYRLTGSEPMDVSFAWGDWKPHAVILVASGLGTGTATLFAQGEPVARLRAGERVAPAVLVEGAANLYVRFDGAGSHAKAGIAIYTATGEQASGVTDGVAVFRDRVAAGQLLDAAFSDGTSAAATIRFNERLDRVRIAEYCRTDDPGLWVNVAVDGERFLYGECGRESDPDPGTGGATWDVPTSGWHTAEVYVTRGEDGPRVPDADAVVGLGAYPVVRTDDGDAATLEQDGRTWLLERVVDADRVTIDTSGGDRLLGYTGRRGQVWVTWRGALDDGRSGTSSTSAGLGAGSATAGVLLAGDSYDVRLHTRGEGASGRILVYRPE